MGIQRDPPMVYLSTVLVTMMILMPNSMHYAKHRNNSTIRVESHMLSYSRARREGGGYSYQCIHRNLHLTANIQAEQ